MPLEPELRAMLTQTITQAPYTGQDPYGKPTYGSAFQRPARVQLRVERLTTPIGIEPRSVTFVICDSDQPITLRDKITLEDGSSPPIQHLYPAPDPEHPGVTHHFELRL